MDLQLAGKRAFVSGSTRGIGYAIAAGLLAEGATVVVNGRTEDSVRGAVDRLSGSVSGLAADFADAAQVRALLAELGEVDILVNNVGVFEVKPFEKITDQDWSRYLEVNLHSGVRLARQLLPGMLARGWGRIAFVSSESGINVPPDMIHYGVTKAAMLALSNGLAKLTRGTEVTVNTIVGGPTYSDGVATAIEQVANTRGTSAAELKATIAAGNATSLLERFLDPAEVASLAVYLASPLSIATNGAAMRADGGVLTTIL